MSSAHVHRSITKSAAALRLVYITIQVKTCREAKLCDMMRCSARTEDNYFYSCEAAQHITLHVLMFTAYLHGSMRCDTMHGITSRCEPAFSVCADFKDNKLRLY